MKRGVVLVLAAATALAVACAPQAPRTQQAPGADAAPTQPVCAYCRMIFQHAEYGGEIHTTSGRRLIYDSVECMAAAVLTDSVPPPSVRTMTVTDFGAPHAAIAAARAVFLHCPSLESPMGLGLSAHATTETARAAQGARAGRTFDWGQVVAYVDSIWFQNRLDAPGHAVLPPPK
jgi:hypothetical protein